MRILTSSALLLVLSLSVAFDAAGAEKGKRMSKNAPGGREGKKQRAVMGDSITFALAHDDELKLNAEQRKFLEKLRQKLEAEREAEKEEVEIKELMARFKAAKRQGNGEAQELRKRANELMEKQAEKWEERTNKELEKVLPKDYMTKLKELRGEPEKIENPFE